MEQPKFRYKEFCMLLDLYKKIYDLDSIENASTLRTMEAKQLFQKTTLHCISFKKLWLVKDDEESYKFLDVHTLASISRNVIETHNVYFYMCEPGISKDEFMFRLFLKNLHETKNLSQILEKFQFVLEKDEVMCAWRFCDKVTKLVLEENSVFKSLPSKDQNELLKGNKAYYFSRIKKQLSPINKEIESGIFNFLSNFVHSFPLGLINFRGGSESNHHLDKINLLFVALETIILYSSFLIKSYIIIRPKLGLKLLKEEKDFISQMTDNSNLNQWLEYRKQRGDTGFILFS